MNLITNKKRLVAVVSVLLTLLFAMALVTIQGSKAYADDEHTFAITTSGHVNAGTAAGKVEQTPGTYQFKITPIAQTYMVFFKIDYVFDKLMVDGKVVDATANGDGTYNYTYTPEGTPREHTMVAYFSPTFTLADAYNLSVKEVRDPDGNKVELGGAGHDTLTIDPNDIKEYYEFTYTAEMNFKNVVGDNPIVAAMYNSYASGSRFKGGSFLMNVAGDGSQIPYDDWTQPSSTNVEFSSQLFEEADPLQRVQEGNNFSSLAYAVDGAFKPTTTMTDEEGKIVMLMKCKVPYTTIAKRLMDSDPSNDQIKASGGSVDGKILSDSDALLGSGGRWQTSAPIVLHTTANVSNTKIVIGSTEELKGVIYHPNRSAGNDYTDDNKGYGYTDKQTPEVITADTAGFTGPTLSLTDDYVWTLDSWNTKADGSGTKYMPGDKLSFDDFTGTPELYAQWKLKTKEDTLLPGDGLVQKVGDAEFDTEHEKPFPVEKGDKINVRAEINAYKVFEQISLLNNSVEELGTGKVEKITIRDFSCPMEMKLTIPKGTSLPADYKDKLSFSCPNDFYVLGDKEDISYKDGVLTVPFKLKKDYSGLKFTELRDDIAALVDNGTIPIKLDINDISINGKKSGNQTFKGYLTGDMNAVVNYDGTSVMKINFPYGSIQDDLENKSDALFVSNAKNISVTVNVDKKGIDDGDKDKNSTNGKGGIATGDNNMLVVWVVVAIVVAAAIVGIHIYRKKEQK